VPKDPFIREKFTRLRIAAKKFASRRIDTRPRSKAGANIEFTIKRLREPIDSAQPIDTGSKEMSSSEEKFAWLS
jgi:hypothetical protein